MTIRRLALFLLIALAARSAMAQTGSWVNWCQAGGQYPILSGLTGSTPVQASYPTCAVTVYLTGTTTPATIYSTITSTPLANPFCAKSDGSILFFASQSAQYDVVISNSNACNPPPAAQLPSTFTFVDAAVSGTGSGGGGGGTITGVNTASGSGLQGGGVSGTLNLGLITCTNGQGLQWLTVSFWTCSSFPSGNVSTTALTAGVVPFASGATAIANSSPQLDIGVTNPNGETFAGTAGLFLTGGGANELDVTNTGSSSLRTLAGTQSGIGFDTGGLFNWNENGTGWTQLTAALAAKMGKAFPVSVTSAVSGGIPCFTSSGTMSSSVVIPSNAFILGEGTGNCVGASVTPGGAAYATLSGWQSAASTSTLALGFGGSPGVQGILQLNGSTSGACSLSASATGGTLNICSTNATMTTSGSLSVFGIIVGAGGCSGCAGGGTVTSVGLNVNGGTTSGIFTGLGSTNPIIATGTFNIQLTGNQGGIPYFGTGGSNASVLNSSATGTAKQITVSGGTGSPVFIDFPDAKVIPAANCYAAGPGAGWSTPTSSFSAACRAGSNNLSGALQAIPNTGASAQFLIELPLDWDTSSQPYINLFYGSGANTSGTVIWTVSSLCSKEDGSIGDDGTFSVESAFASQTMAAANRVWAKNGQFTHMTSGNNCIPGSWVLIQVALSGTATSNINAYEAVVTIPRLLTVQAN